MIASPFIAEWSQFVSWAAVEERATADDTTTSEIIREALRRFLHVA